MDTDGRMNAKPPRRPAGELSVVEAISSKRDLLRRSERKVADIVLTNPDEVLHLTMAGLAELAGVSEPTVMRFCKAMGTGGFPEFKLLLAHSLALGLSATQTAIRPGDSTSELITKVFDQTISSIDRARRGLELDRVEEAVALLAGASQALFVGFGASGIVAQDAEQKFPLFGIPCSAPVDAHQQFIAASMMGPGSVVVALSNTGRTEAVLDIALTAQEQGASVIGISGDRGPLLEIADVPLLVMTFEDTDLYTPTVSRLAALVVIDILATGVALRRPPEHQIRLQHMKEELAGMRTGLRPRRRPKAARSDSMAN